MPVGLLGKKVGMTQVYDDGVMVPVTVIQAGPCHVLQVRTVDTDGYEAVQLGFGDKPVACHLAVSVVMLQLWIASDRKNEPNPE